MKNTIKFIHSKQIVLNGKVYKPYLVGELPSTFGFIYNEDKDQEGITEWFNYKGLTYLKNNNMKLAADLLQELSMYINLNYEDDWYLQEKVNRIKN